MRTRGNSGGGGSETLLWTNPSPSNDFTYGAVTLTGGHVSDFSEIKLVYKIDKSSTQYEHIAKFDTDAFIGSVNENRVGICGQDITATYGRMMYYTDETHISFGQSLQIYGSSIYNNKLIPLYIYGVK